MKLKSQEIYVSMPHLCKIDELCEYMYTFYETVFCFFLNFIFVHFVNTSSSVVYAGARLCITTHWTHYFALFRCLLDINIIR